MNLIEIVKHDSSLLEERECHFSPCRAYRYALIIRWNREFPLQMFIGLNPSTAEEKVNDPTIRRCIEYSRSWQKGGLVMANACAFRATDPKVMLAAADPIGPANTIEYLKHLAVSFGCGLPVAAWGRNAKRVMVNQFHNQADRLRVLMGPMSCFGINADGTPKHPLYLPKRAELVRFT